MKNMAKLSLFFIFTSFASLADKVTIKENILNLKTYPYSDESPLPNFERIYPYTTFDGYTSTSSNKPWKAVVLENDHIKVIVLPEMGGKVWGAIEKSTGNDFLYQNDVAKFRKVSMRGPWTSGGIEFNYGTIGHSQNTVFPVDYITKEHDDGSVSVTVGDYDFASRSRWNVEISLKPDAAYFETSGFWSNLSEMPSSFYYWSNAAAKAGGDLEILANGKYHINHDGVANAWPIDDKKRNINFYNKNNFGPDKSYHVINGYDDFLGGYWHDDSFGFGHIADYTQLPGRKVWLWAQSDLGGIWEDFLTDGKGQYIEWQSGRFFSQADSKSAKTPYRPQGFMPNDTFRTNEKWFPILNTEGSVATSSVAVLNVKRTDNKVTIFMSPMVSKNVTLVVTSNNKNILQKSLSLKPAKPLKLEFSLDKNEAFVVSIPEAKLFYNSVENASLLDRPTATNQAIDWDSADGLFRQGVSADSMRLYEQAEKFFNDVLTLEPEHVQVLSYLAMLHYRNGQYESGLKYAYKSLINDAYDAKSNYVYGLLNSALDKRVEAKAAFSLASIDTKLRTAALYQLAVLNAVDGEWEDAKKNALKSLRFNSDNLKALELLSISQRMLKDVSGMEQTWEKITKVDATHHFINAEKYLQSYVQHNKEQKGGTAFFNGIHNEFPEQTVQEIASTYINIGLVDDAIAILLTAKPNPMRDYWLSYLNRQLGNKKASDKFLSLALTHEAEKVFPFRLESMKILESLNQVKRSWKSNYYLALIYISKGRSEEAFALLSRDKNKPSFSPFYIVRANLAKKINKPFISDLKLAVKYDKNGWRANDAYARALLIKGSFSKALEPANAAQVNGPTVVAPITLYATALIDNDKNQQALDYLANKELLPAEHANEGRGLYYFASIKLAVKALGLKNYTVAIAKAEDAVKWPVNLGSGRPYDVDERLPNYIKAIALDKLGQKKLADKLFTSIANFQSDLRTRNDLLSALSAKTLGNLKALEEYRASNDNEFKKILDTDVKSKLTALKQRSLLLDGLILQLYNQK